MARARRDGFRSRAAYKLAEIDDRFGVLVARSGVVDLGCAPGGWCQVAVARGATPVVGVDLDEVESVEGAIFLRGDLREPGIQEAILELAAGDCACVLSDMAAPATGHRFADRLRVSALAEEAAAFALEALRPGGNFVAKVLRAGVPESLAASLAVRFESVRHFKPAASRIESDEIYIVARGLRASRV